MNKGLKETVKSFLRFVYFGLLGLVGTFIASIATSTDLQNTVINIGGMYLQVGTAIGVGLAGLAKLIDRYIHKADNIKLTGITPVDLMRK